LYPDHPKENTLNVAGEFPSGYVTQAIYWPLVPPPELTPLGLVAWHGCERRCVVTRLSNLPSRTLASDVQPVNMELLTDDGRQVAGPQQLGTNLQLKYTLNGGDG